MISFAENREQHLQKFHAQMQSWQHELERVSSATHSANSYLQGEMNRLVSQIDKGLHQLTQRLVEVAENGDRRVYSALESVESAWSSLKGRVDDLTQRMRERRSQAEDSLQEGVEQARDTVEQGVSQMKQAAGEGRQALRDVVERGGEQARELLDQGRQALREGGEQASQALRGGKRGQSARPADAGRDRNQP